MLMAWTRTKTGENNISTRPCKWKITFKDPQKKTNEPFSIFVRTGTKTHPPPAWTHQAEYQGTWYAWRLLIFTLGFSHLGNENLSIWFFFGGETKTQGVDCCAVGEWQSPLTKFFGFVVISSSPRMRGEHMTIFSVTQSSKFGHQNHVNIYVGSTISMPFWKQYLLADTPFTAVGFAFSNVLTTSDSQSKKCINHPLVLQYSIRISSTKIKTTPLSNLWLNIHVSIPVPVFSPSQVVSIIFVQEQTWCILIILSIGILIRHFGLCSSLSLW